jgi:hypothetical protein
MARGRTKRLTFSLAAVLGVVLISPAFAYLIGLASIPSFPDPPATRTVAESSMQQQWELHSGNRIGYGSAYDSMALTKINPWSYTYHLLVRCRDQSGGSDAIHRCTYYFPGYRAALSVAAVHLFGSPLNVPTAFFDELKVASLSIWLTRNWAPHQIAAYLASHRAW